LLLTVSLFEAKMCKCFADRKMHGYLVPRGGRERIGAQECRPKSMHFDAVHFDLGAYGLIVYCSEESNKYSTRCSIYLDCRANLFLPKLSNWTALSPSAQSCFPARSHETTSKNPRKYNSQHKWARPRIPQSNGESSSTQPLSISFLFIYTELGNQLWEFGKLCCSNGAIRPALHAHYTRKMLQGKGT